MKDLTTTEKLAIMREISEALPADPEIKSVDISGRFSAIGFKWDGRTFVVQSSNLSPKQSVKVAGHSVVILEGVVTKPERDGKPFEENVKTQLCHLIDRCVVLRQDVDLVVI